MPREEETVMKDEKKPSINTQRNVHEPEKVFYTPKSISPATPTKEPDRTMKEKVVKTPTA